MKNKTKNKADHCNGSEVQEVSVSGITVILEEASAILPQKKSSNKIRDIRLQKRLTETGFSLSSRFSSLQPPKHIIFNDRARKNEHA